MSVTICHRQRLQTTYTTLLYNTVHIVHILDPGLIPPPNHCHEILDSVIVLAILVRILCSVKQLNTARNQIINKSWTEARFNF